jgi:hypothetical protein
MVLVVEELVVQAEAVMLLVEAQAVILVLEEVGVVIITLMVIHTPLMKDVIITVPTMIIVYIYSSSSYHISLKAYHVLSSFVLPKPPVHFLHFLYFYVLEVWQLNLNIRI